MSEVTLQRWRAEYGAEDRDAVPRLRELKKENARLKRLVAEKELDILILKEVAKGGILSPAPLRHAQDSIFGPRFRNHFAKLLIRYQAIEAGEAGALLLQLSQPANRVPATAP